jgi:hypothetical protein
MNEEHLRKICAGHKDERVELAAMSDEDIDFSDIPEMTDENWKHAARGFYFLPAEQRRALRKQMIEDIRSNWEDSVGGRDG